jgi:ABC-type polysaccharide transport system permease subunit
MVSQGGVVTETGGTRQARDEAFVTPKGKAGGLANKEWFLFLLFIFPNFFFLALFTYWPLWKNVLLSLQQTNLLAFSGEPDYVGLENYQWIFSNSTFQLVLRNTVVFISACVGFTLLFGLMIALLLNEKLKYRNGVRALVFAPFLLSGAAIGIVWAYISIRGSGCWRKSSTGSASLPRTGSTVRNGRCPPSSSCTSGRTLALPP